MVVCVAWDLLMRQWESLVHVWCPRLLLFTPGRSTYAATTDPPLSAGLSVPTFPVGMPLLASLVTHASVSGLAVIQVRMCLTECAKQPNEG